MDQEKDLGMCIACQCGPVLLGLKSSNILMTKSLDLSMLASLLKDTRVKGVCLCPGLSLLYDQTMLQEDLLRPDIQSFLAQYGYKDFNLQACLDRLSSRLLVFKDRRGGFPHEMGIFLGYPLDDVKGFIKHQGKNYLYSGYWKVYANVQQAKKAFETYKIAREFTRLSYCCGMTFCNIISSYKAGQVTSCTG